MKKVPILLIFFFVTGLALGQKTLLVEKIGTPRKYYYKAGDFLKLRVSPQDTLLKGHLWSIRDSVITVESFRPFDVRIGDIGSVYKRYAYPKKFGRYMMIGSGVFFGIIGINHLLNNEQVITPGMFIFSGALLGAGIISLSLSEKRCKIGIRWRIKILDMNVVK